MRGFDETVKPMTLALLHAQFRSLPTCRKRLQLKKIKDGASKTSIGEQGAPARMLSVARWRCGRRARTRRISNSRDCPALACDGAERGKTLTTMTNKHKTEWKAVAARITG